MLLRGTYGSQAPVKYADKNLDWRGDQREIVLDGEELGGGCHVCKKARGKGRRGDGETEYGEVLEMPAKRFILEVLAYMNTGPAGFRWNIRSGVYQQDV